jgi:hypothetical protein
MIGRFGYGGKFMGLKGKILAVLIVYFAGFATALYALAPANPASVAAQTAKKPVSFPQSFTKSDQFARSCAYKMQQAAAAIKTKCSSLNNKS